MEGANLSRELLMADEKKPIDWPAIRTDWEKSEWSIKRIAEWYQVSDTAIRKRAKAEAWPERAKMPVRKVRGDDVAQTAPVIMAGIDATDPAEIVGKGHNLIFRLLDELDATTTHHGQLAELIEAHEEDPRRRAAMMKAIELPGRAIRAILAALWKPVALLLALLAVWWRGRASAKQQTALEAAEAYAKTRKGMDDAPDLGNDPYAARRWLRERDANQR